MSFTLRIQIMGKLYEDEHFDDVVAAAQRGKSLVSIMSDSEIKHAETYVYVIPDETFEYDDEGNEVSFEYVWNGITWYTLEKEKLYLQFDVFARVEEYLVANELIVNRGRKSRIDYAEDMVCDMLDEMQQAVNEPYDSSDADDLAGRIISGMNAFFSEPENEDSYYTYRDYFVRRAEEGDE